MSRAGAGQKKVQVLLTIEAHGMLLAMMRTTGSRVSPLVERAVRRYYLTDELHKMALAQRPLELPDALVTAPRAGKPRRRGAPR